MLKPRHLLMSLFIAANGCFLQSASVPIALAQVAPAPGLAERERGIAHYNQNKTKEAVSTLKSAVKKDKTDHQAWYYLGLAQVKLKDYKEAAKSLQKVVQLQPDFALGHNAMAYTALMRDRLSEAKREADLTLRLDPNIKEAHYISGVANLREGDTVKALKAAEVVIKLDPKLAVGYLLKSQALVGFAGTPSSPPGESTEVRNARYLEAAGALEKYLELDPNTKYKQTWIEQLDSLRFYVSARDEGSSANRAYSGKEVTTKARVLAKPEPRYSEDARKRGVTGTVVLRCIFAADGTPKHFIVVAGLPYGLTENALAAARKIRFTPATRDGKPVSMFIQLEYNFNLY